MYYQRRRDGKRGESAVPAGGWEAAVYSVDTDDFVSMCITSIDKTGGLFVCFFDISSADAGSCAHCLVGVLDCDVMTLASSRRALNH